MCVCVNHDRKPFKIGELIEMLFRMRAQVDPGNHVLDGGAETPGNEHFWGLGTRHSLGDGRVQSIVSRFKR